MHVRFLEKDSDSVEGELPTLFRASQFTNAAGEDIRYVNRDVANDAHLPNHDYWLFDSCKLAMMHFGEHDRFLGAEIIEDPAMIVQHNYWRDAAWHCAVRRDDFGTEQG
jgi:hypothetical protein